MKLRYEIHDSHASKTLRGQRFTALPNAMRELHRAVGVPGRWHLIDRQTGETLQVSK